MQNINEKDNQLQELQRQINQLKNSLEVIKQEYDILKDGYQSQKSISQSSNSGINPIAKGQLNSQQTKSNILKQFKLNCRELLSSQKYNNARFRMNFLSNPKSNVP